MTRLCLALALSLLCSLSQALVLSAISSTEANSGLKTALTKGADYAVSTLGKQDGFLGNSKVRIGLPDKSLGLAAE